MVNLNLTKKCYHPRRFQRGSINLLTLFISLSGVMLLSSITFIVQNNLIHLRFSKIFLNSKIAKIAQIETSTTTNDPRPSLIKTASAKGSFKNFQITNLVSFINNRDIPHPYFDWNFASKTFKEYICTKNTSKKSISRFHSTETCEDEEVLFKESSLLKSNLSSKSVTVDLETEEGYLVIRGSTKIDTLILNPKPNQRIWLISLGAIEIGTITSLNHNQHHLQIISDKAESSLLEPVEQYNLCENHLEKGFEKNSKPFISFFGRKGVFFKFLQPDLGIIMLLGCIQIESFQNDLLWPSNKKILNFYY